MEEEEGRERERKKKNFREEKKIFLHAKDLHTKENKKKNNAKTKQKKKVNENHLIKQIKNEIKKQHQGDPNQVSRKGL